MMNHRVRASRIEATFAAITAIAVIAWVILLTAPIADADATPPRTQRVTINPSICDTGFRGDPAYDRACLRKGVVGDAGALWYGIPRGRKGHESDDFADRRSICAYAPRYGGIKTMVTELITDMTYDSFTNNAAVDRWAVSMARVDCTAMGYRV